MKFIIEMQIGDGWMRATEETYDGILAADRAKDKEQKLHPALNFKLTEVNDSSDD